MLSASLNSIVRSSLEEMLVNLQHEDERPKDLPPELPSRPKPARKARLPTSIRRLPIQNSGDVKKNVETNKKDNTFTAKKPKDSHGSESPYNVSKDKIGAGNAIKDVNTAKRKSFKYGIETKFMETEIDDNIGYFIRKKLRIWCCLKTGEWVSGQIKSTSIDKATVVLSDGSVVTVPTVNLTPANPDILEGVDDLIQLSYLNEPSVLHNLQHRYSRNIIYSRAGPVLVAVNPFKKVEIYGNEQIMAYRQKLVDNPHVYAIADAAYNEVMSDEVNQSVIISGESGAGKTETAKIAMQYLATLSGGNDGIQSEILQTNNILEAFGNAKTCRNDNSSRFGKLTAIHFSATGKICGARIQTCLLEKSRVVQVAKGERSYHIFYQLCAGAPSDLREKLNLRSANVYHYLNQSKCLTINNVDDADRFHKIMDSLRSLRISKEDQEHAFEMLAAVLWLGNISFSVIDNENHIEVLDDEAISFTASLLGCRAKDLMLALSTHEIQAGRDKVSKRLNLQQATNARDALAKLIYESLFDWLVEEINKSLGVGTKQTGRSISILDIYGFESLKKNSFEQLCINYANERLQQHFNRHLFKLEQEEYESDGIDWTKVDFVDNQVCLDLFEKKPIGLISLLDEESKFPRATDVTFANKLKQHLDGNSCFKGLRGGSFSVVHSAAEVLYDTSGFLDKNRDSLHSDTIQLLSLCQGRLPQALSSVWRNQSLKQSVATKFKGQLFNLMQQLESTTPHFIRCIKPNSKQVPGLYENETVLEQLRCCGVLEVVRIARSGYPTRLTHQEFATRYGFLLSEVGAPQDPLSTSISILRQFNILPEMYQVGYTKLYFRTGQIGELERMRRQLLQSTIEVQKCFRARQARHFFNELRGGATTLQSIIRGETDRRQYRTLLNIKEQDARIKHEQQLRAVAQIQSGIRGLLARNHLQRLLRSRKLEQTLKSQIAAAVQIQSGIRGWLAKSHMDRLSCSRKSEQKLKEQTAHNKLIAVVQIQSGIRGWLARNRIGRLLTSRILVQKLKDQDARSELDQRHSAVVQIQSGIRGWLARNYLGRLLHSSKSVQKLRKQEALNKLDLQCAAVQIQSGIRGWLARNHFGKLQNSRKLVQYMSSSRSAISELKDLPKGTLLSIIEELHRRVDSTQVTLSQKQKTNVALREQVRRLKEQRLEYKAKIESMESSWKKEKKTLQMSLAEAKKSLGIDDSSGQFGKAECSSLSPDRKPADTPKINDNGYHHGFSQLLKEFNKNKQTLDEKAKALMDVNSGQPKPASPVQEYRQLKQQFQAFTKDFKIRLKQLRARVYKLGHSEGDRSLRKLWLKSKKIITFEGRKETVKVIGPYPPP